VGDAPTFHRAPFTLDALALGDCGRWSAFAVTIVTDLRAALWILVVLLVVLVGVVAPSVYLYGASGLPSLETEFDLEAQLRPSIEGERRSHQLGQATPEHALRFERPDFTRLPKDLVALFISRMGCPSFFQSPREHGLRWGWRLTSALLTGNQPDGDGWCERALAIQIAESFGVTGGLPQTVAAQKLHTFLQKDQLVAYYLATLRFDRAVVGVEHAAAELFHKPLSQLRLEQLAELMLAFDYFEDVKRCRNPGLIRRNRDYLLQIIIVQGLVPEERGKAAQAASISCQAR
jgi:hypothetical protein